MNEVDYTSLVELSRRFEVAAKLAPKLADDFLVHQIAVPAVEEMKRTAPVKEGKLKDSLRYTHTGPLKVSIGSFGVSYAKFVSEGTKPHEIRPKNASVLVFTIGNRKIYSKVVHHPGTKANPYMTDSFDKVYKRVLPRLAGVMAGPLKKRVK